MDALDFIDGIAALAHPNEEILYQLVQGRLSPSRANAVEEHLARCPHCRELAGMFRSSSAARQPVEFVSLPLEGKRHEAKPGAAARSASGDVSFMRPRRAWRLTETERLAASDAEISGDGLAASASKTDLVQLVPNATDGAVALGYLCAGGIDVVVTGVGDRAAKVVLDGEEYEVRNGAVNEPRVVEGLTRQKVAVWLTRRPGGGFKVVYA